MLRTDGSWSRGRVSRYRQRSTSRAYGASSPRRCLDIFSIRFNLSSMSLGSIPFPTRSTSGGIDCASPNNSSASCLSLAKSRDVLEICGGGMLCSPWLIAFCAWCSPGGPGRLPCAAAWSPQSWNVRRNAKRESFTTGLRSNSYCHSSSVGLGAPNSPSRSMHSWC